MFLTTLRFYFNISIGQDSIRILTYAYIFWSKNYFYEITKEYDMINNINILYEDTQILEVFVLASFTRKFSKSADVGSGVPATNA